MRFISRMGRFSVVARHPITEAFATGIVRTVQTQIICQFHEGGLLPNERELALAHWTFNGSYQEMDEVTTVAPDYRIGVYDTIQAQIDNQWTNEERKEVERVLIQEAELLPGDVMLVPETRLEPPWPRYDIFDGSLVELVQKVVDDGYLLSDVLAYERTNQNREDVVIALEAMIADQAAEVEEVIAG